MKNIYKIIIGLSIVFFSGSCTDVMDQQPLDAISDAVVWQDEALVNAYLNEVYRELDIFNLQRSGNEFTIGTVASMGAELRTIGPWQGPYKAAMEIITESGEHSTISYWSYDNIRTANFGIQKLQEESELDAEFIEQKVAELKFLRAYMYFEMVKRYGGVPLITEAQSINAPQEELYPSRNSEKEVYDFIISELEEVSTVLPEIQPDGVSRSSKWAALTLQSRAALYAASIAQFGEVQLDGLLGFPAADAENYAQIAYDAANTIINESGLALYKVHDDLVKNFQELFIDESSDNTEVIMAQRFHDVQDMGHNFIHLTIPDGFDTSWGSNFPVMYDLVEAFEFMDGSPGNSITREQLVSQEWSVDELFTNRDPRFRASVFYPETPFQGSVVLFHSSTLVNGEEQKGNANLIDGTDWPASSPGRNNNRTGFHLKKRIDESHVLPIGFDDDTDLIIFRLGEVYLNLAEAALYLNKTEEATNAINAMRERAGMPLLTSVTMDDLIHERQVELAFEDHRYWDLRRWRIAEEVLNGLRTQGLKYVYNWDTKKYQISLVNAENNARTFQERHYYFPISVGNIAENPNLVENPGYTVE